MSKLDARELQRLRYWQGQMLRSRDFRDQLAIDAQLRWWHNRALHNSFGVSLGLNTSLMPENGLHKAVRVCPGLAYDCFGRELILQEMREIPLPPAPQDDKNTMLTLLIRYKETSQYPKRHSVEAGCLPGACARFEEEPEFIWKPSTHIQADDGIPLARVVYKESTANLDYECMLPRSRPFARPHIASGATLKGATVWEDWSSSFGKLLGLQVKIDTSAAGFTDVPCYFAWLQGSSIDQVQAALFLVLFYDHIDDASISGFTFRLFNPFPEFLADLKQQFFVSWVGIQPNTDFVNDFDRYEVNHGNS